MTREDYLEEMVADIETYWFDDKNGDRFEDTDADDIYQELNDDLFVSDVTGNASGSYTFNTWQARENVLGAEDVLKDACSEFGCMDVLGEKFLDGEWEWMDVTIRCYLLGEAIGMFMQKHDLY